MRVFVSGVAGFLGSHLAAALLADGHEVTGIDNLIGGDEENVPTGVEFAAIDCNDFRAVRSLMRGSGLVYHLAATAHEGLSVFSPHENAMHGYAASASMFSSAAAVGARRVVFASSMARYGTNKLPFTEEMAPRPQDPYGVGKVAAEELLRLLAKVHGFEFVIAAPHNIYGPVQRYTDPFRNVPAIFINRMLQGKQPILYGDGSQKRCFSFVSDVVAPLTKLGFDPGCAGQVFNLGPDDEFVTVHHLAETIARLLRFELRPIYQPDRPQEVQEANCSADKARRLLGYAPKVSLEDGLRQSIDWIRSRGPRPFDYHLDLEIVNGKTPRTWLERLI